MTRKEAITHLAQHVANLNSSMSREAKQELIARWKNEETYTDVYDKVMEMQEIELDVFEEAMSIMEGELTNAKA